MRNAVAKVSNLNLRTVPVYCCIRHEILNRLDDNIVAYIRTYYKSDVWLTVHRNSVWIRKTN